MFSATFSTNVLSENLSSALGLMVESLSLWFGVNMAVNTDPVKTEHMPL